MARIKTDHKAGDLHVDAEEMAVPLMAVPEKWPRPKRMCFNDWLLSPLNQGNDPACGGFAGGAVVSYINWRKHISYGQIPGLPIYDKAKEIDGYNGPGTYLRYIVEALKILKHIPMDWELYRCADPDAIRFAMHRHAYVGFAGLMITEGWNNCDTETGEIDETMTKSLGGHLVVYSCCDDRGGYDECLNSWGPEHGRNGFVRMSHEAFDEQYITGGVISKPGGVA